MSTGKLDQSLDEILYTQRRNATGRRRSTRRVATAGRPAAAAAPAGGIQKSKITRSASGKGAPARSAGAVGESKIVVSNLVSNSPAAPAYASHTKTPRTNAFCSPRTFPKARSRYVTDEGVPTSAFYRRPSSAGQSYRHRIVSSVDNRSASPFPTGRQRRAPSRHACEIMLAA